MPLDFLTQAERQRYQRLPAAIAERDLRQHFHLREADRAFVATFRGATSRLGVALPLGLLRYLGYLPDDWAVSIPAELRAFVAGQLANGALVDLVGYGSREATRTAHLQAALQHLGWSKWTSLEQGWLEPWLLERALEHDNERSCGPMSPIKHCRRTGPCSIISARAWRSPLARDSGLWPAPFALRGPGQNPFAARLYRHGGEPVAYRQLAKRSAVSPDPSSRFRAIGSASNGLKSIRQQYPLGRRIPILVPALNLQVLHLQRAKRLNKCLGQPRIG